MPTLRSEQKIIVIGGGAGGLSVANALSRKGFSVTLIEPKAHHYYQPGLTLYPFGMHNEKTICRPVKDLLHDKVEWVRDKVSLIDPVAQRVKIEDGLTLDYDILVVASGIDLCWDEVAGLRQGLQDPESGVISVCDFQHAKQSIEKIDRFAKHGGHFISVMPQTNIKCPGVPIKMVFLMNTTMGEGKSFSIFSPKESCMVGDPYDQILLEELKKLNTGINYGQQLVEIDPKKSVATFAYSDGGAEKIEFSLIHVVPPMRPGKFLASLGDSKGYLPVDWTMQHNEFPNVFGIGDCVNLPGIRKTAAAVRKQIPVVIENITAHAGGRPLLAAYGGYSCCPVPIDARKVLMMEFGPGGHPEPGKLNWVTGTKPSCTMGFVKRRVIPLMYWRVMVKGLPTP